MRRSSFTRRIALAVTVLLAGAGSVTAAATPPKTTTTTPTKAFTVKHTDAGTAAARRLLPTLVEFGPGWTSTSASAQESALTCPANAPRLEGVIETGSAVSDSFQNGTSGPFVSGAAWTYGSPSQMSTVWREAVAAGLLKCFVASVKSGSTSAVKLTVKASAPASFPKVAPYTAAYTVTASAHAGSRDIPAYYYVIVLGNGSRVAELSFARFSAPVSRSLELPLARAVAHRLQNGSS